MNFDAPSSETDSPDEFGAFLRSRPDLQAVDALVADLSGVIRGKRYPVDLAAKVFRDGLAMPGSVFLLDTRGECNDAGGRGFSDGDPDVRAEVVPGSLKPVPWADEALAQVMLRFFEADGTPYAFEPRNVLARVAARFNELDLRPVVACELEFYLIDPERDASGAPQAPISPVTGRRDHNTQVYGMNEVDAFAGVLAEITRACRSQDVPAGVITAEYAPGQFEINLHHVDDPVLAADHCVLFKRAVKGVARRHGLGATFMAKPYADQVGSGLHLHLSLLDGEGRNVFDDGQGGSSPMLRHAVGGILAALGESMAMLAPNPNAYRRFAPNRFVPIRRTWGFENRSVALRIPLGSGASRRIEHRVAGADANPYLALATALAAAHYGLTEKVEPDPAFAGNAGYDFDPGLPFRFREALERLDEAQILPAYVGSEYLSVYKACKLAELERFEAPISPLEYDWYLQAD